MTPFGNSDFHYKQRTSSHIDIGYGQIPNHQDFPYSDLGSKFGNKAVIERTLALQGPSVYIDSRDVVQHRTELDTYLLKGMC
ncbi:hypothetical protein PanWU01x14_364720 [Parasponia andersonii]|uniref:Uncharacterized protein n=1 Tax=Parasponia andersonii TaxID=3476 RepID=A0A2P5A6A0_PARAD|nr:hypothetical protein PanWU01x14_364720 [Parasponia andersonii]